MKLINDNKNLKTKIMFTLGIIFMLILVIGATFAYFDMTGVYDETKTLVKGKTLTDYVNAPTLISNTTVLKMNITNTDMAYPNIGKKFYATPSGTLVPESEVSLNNGRYVLGTASVNEQELSYNCNAEFKLSAEVTNKLSRASSDNIVVVLTDNLGNITSYTLTQILSGDKIVLGNIFGLDNEENQSFYIEAYVLNSEENQTDLIDNPFTINIVPVKEKDSFYCDTYTLDSGKVVAAINENILTLTITNGKSEADKYCINKSVDTTDCTWENVTSLSISKTLTSLGTYYAHIMDKLGNIIHSRIKYEPTGAKLLIYNGELWQSGLEGDGYRYAGTGILCSYDEGNYITTHNPEITKCPTLYNYTRTKISDGSTTNYTYSTSCPSDTSTYTYTCTELAGILDNSNVPNNFICFGTNDKTECKNNEAKYMYRIIGVFPDSSGTQHLKLISLKELSSTYRWHADNTTDVAWENSDMYRGLNGEYFLTNTTYDYLQNNTWLNKIENWTWSAVNTKTRSDGGPSYNSIRTQEMYLHEMNRSNKTSSIGEWSTSTAKIGLMYASDYQMSLGSSALAMIGNVSPTRFKRGWMHPRNNDTSGNWEWTLSRFGDNGGDFYAWHVSDFVSNSPVRSGYKARPVFHLTSDARINGGNGEYENPYILE